MTNEEAIKWLKYHIGITYYEETDELLIALKKAIKALEEQNTRKDGRQKNVLCESERFNATVQRLH